jgi:uncharacterized protein YcnI
VQAEAPKLLSLQKAVPKFPSACDERATRKIKSVCSSGRAKSKKVARPGHKVVAKDMGQKNKSDRPVGDRMCTSECRQRWRCGKLASAGRQAGLIPSTTGINIIDGFCRPQMGSARRVQPEVEEDHRLGAKVPHEPVVFSR